MPDFAFEQKHDGSVCGCDEVGRAPLAGPVVAGCVYIPVENHDNPLWQQVNDSKLIPRIKRGALAEEIKQACFWGIGAASVAETDEINNVQASFLAMRRAFTHCFSRESGNLNDPHITKDPRLRGEGMLALIDGNLTPKEFPCPTETIVKGDTKSVSIAAASVLAKVYRDEMMAELAQIHPHYGWERNAGYPTKEHLAGINAHGITEHHRRSFAPVRNFIEFGTTERQIKMAV